MGDLRVVLEPHLDEAHRGKFGEELQRIIKQIEGFEDEIDRDSIAAAKKAMQEAHSKRPR